MKQEKKPLTDEYIERILRDNHKETKYEKREAEKKKKKEEDKGKK